MAFTWGSQLPCSDLVRPQDFLLFGCWCWRYWALLTTCSLSSTHSEFARLSPLSSPVGLSYWKPLLPTFLYRLVLLKALTNPFLSCRPHSWQLVESIPIASVTIYSQILVKCALPDSEYQILCITAFWNIMLSGYVTALRIQYSRPKMPLIHLSWYLLFLDSVKLVNRKDLSIQLSQPSLRSLTYLCCQRLVQDTIVSPRCLHQLFSSFSNPHQLCCLLPTLFSHQAVRVNLANHKLMALVALEWNPHFRLAKPS